MRTGSEAEASPGELLVDARSAHDRAGVLSGPTALSAAVAGGLRRGLQGLRGHSGCSLLWRPGVDRTGRVTGRLCDADAQLASRNPVHTVEVWRSRSRSLAGCSRSSGHATPVADAPTRQLRHRPTNSTSEPPTGKRSGHSSVTTRPVSRCVPTSRSSRTTPSSPSPNSTVPAKRSPATVTTSRKGSSTRSTRSPTTTTEPSPSCWSSATSNRRSRQISRLAAVRMHVARTNGQRPHTFAG